MDTLLDRIYSWVWGGRWLLSYNGRLQSIHRCGAYAHLKAIVIRDLLDTTVVVSPEFHSMQFSRNHKWFY